ncbi:hypothetical protein H9P43_002306 [Blastocladiella emersonii ATCC 22665]|nr:hypothetical protein H9P43_002306 [Blastocladiella emersonii ATCC 22665]
MSGRAMRRLLREKEEQKKKLEQEQAPPAAAASDEEEEAESSEDEAPVRAKPFNPFALLMGDDDDEEEEESEQEEEEEAEPESAPVVAAAKKQPAPPAAPASDAESASEAEEEEEEEIQRPVRKGKKNKKKNKKAAAAKGKGKAATTANVDDLTLEELDAVLAPVRAETGGTPEPDAAAATEIDAAAAARDELLAIDAKNMDPDNEMARLFGADVVQRERRQQQRAQQQLLQQQLGGRNARRGAASLLSARKTLLAGTPDATWPRFETLGLAVTRQPRADTGADVLVYQHPSRYQTVHMQFLAAAATGDPNALVALSAVHPYHAETMLQLSRIAGVTGQPDMATEFRRRAGYALERAFPPSNPLGRLTLPVPYAAPTNRTLYLALLALLDHHLSHAAVRTALEHAKLMLRLDPTDDPLAVRGFIDAIALRAREGEWLRKWVAAQDPASVPAYPHWLFSLALAQWQDGDAEAAGEALARAARAYPGVAQVVCPPLSLVGEGLGDASVVPPAVHLYSHYAKAVWADPAVVAWIQSLPVVRVAAADRMPVDTTSGAMAVYRHIVAGDLNSLTGQLPAHVRTPAMMDASDPVPPTPPTLEDGAHVFPHPYAAGFTAGNNPQQQAAAGGGIAANANPLAAFLQSILPWMQGVEGAAEPDLEQLGAFRDQLPPHVFDTLGAMIANGAQGAGPAAGQQGEGDEEGDEDYDSEEEEEEEWEDAPEEWEDYSHLLNPEEGQDD